MKPLFYVARRLIRGPRGGLQETITLRMFRSKTRAILFAKQMRHSNAWRTDVVGIGMTHDKFAIAETVLSEGDRTVG